jgi:iron complex outermembrane recepter protein
MRTILALLLLNCLAVAGIAQGYPRMQGKILDEYTGEPLPGVIIQVPQTNIGGISDEEGIYRIDFREIPNLLVVKYFGYQTDTLRNLIDRWPKDQSVYELDIQLKEEIYDPDPYCPPIIIYDYLRNMDRVSAAQTQRGDLSSVEQGLNLVPGVKFESRGPGGSRRLAIRGGFLRSPFGVRDVKAYLDGAPLTSPDGSTALELIDPVGIERTTILKGPCASEFGPVSNGVVKFSLRQNANQLGQTGGMLNQTLGAYGYARSVAQVGWQRMGYDINSHLSLTYIRQRYTGYRDQEANSKHQLQLYANKSFEKFSLGGSLMLYQGAWELPGSLDSLEVATNPKQALAISKSLDAHVARRHLRASLINTVELSHKAKLNNSIYLHLSDKENPFGTSAFNQGYKVENSEGMGGRFIFEDWDRRFKYRLGGDWEANTKRNGSISISMTMCWVNPGR